MIQSSVFNPYQKRVSSSRRKLKKAIYQPKLIRQQAQQLFKIPIIKAFGERVILTRNTDDSRFIKKAPFIDDEKNQRNKMILVAKKIGCYIDPPLFLQGMREERKEAKKESNKERETEEYKEGKREVKELESTMNDSELRISRLKPSSVSIQTTRLHQSYPKTANYVNQDKPPSSRHTTFLILSSKNNQQLVRKILSSRKNWKEIKKGEGVPNFRWLAGDYDHSVFEKAKSTTFMKRAVNQFEFHQQITTKNGLIRNLQTYMETKKLQLFSMTPITFVIDFDEEYCEFNIRQFLNFFLKNSTKHKDSTGSFSPNKSISYQRVNSFIEKLRPYFNPHPELRKKLNPLSRPDMKAEYINGDSYLWLLKPTGLNRGRGIEIFNNLQDLQTFLLNYLALAGRKALSLQSSKTVKKESLSNISTLPSLSNQQSQNINSKKPANEQFILKTCSFVIQKYIEKPMLIRGRKFDIRVWVFLNYDFSLYFFKEGYLRLSSEQFSLDVSNYFIHLTNNAIQKHSKEYGSIEQGNQLSFKTFREYLEEQGHSQQFQSIISKIKQYSYTSVNSVKNKLNPKQQKYCFQLFGFDYIVDHNFKVWLIQVNNNPCIQLSSPLLAQLIPRMLNDAFKMSLDKVFKVGKEQNPEKTEGQRQNDEKKDGEKEQKAECFKVDGYCDNQNMWEELGKLYPNSEYVPK